MTVDFNIMIGGEAGQGVQSVVILLAKTMARRGFHIFTDQDFESRVRGGHNILLVVKGVQNQYLVQGTQAAQVLTPLESHLGNTD